MWLCIDRIEGDTVVLLADDKTVYRLTVAACHSLTGRPPAESDVLSATVVEGRITAAAYDEEETNTRKAAARARLDRLFGRR